MNNVSVQRNTAKLTFFGKFKKASLKFLLFAFFLLFILYFFFPYAVVKNYLESQIQAIFIQNNILIDLKIKSSRPYWLTGMQFKNISIQNMYDNKRIPFKISKLTVRVSILPLLIGRISVNMNIQQQNTGNSHVFISLPLWSIFDLENLKKYEIETEFKQFDVRGLTDQALGMVQSSATPTLALITPVIAVTSFGGYLNGAFKFQANDNARTGFSDITFNQFYFFVNDPSLNIPKQNFKQGRLFLDWDQNTINIEDQTVFESENFYLKPKGTVKTAGKTSILDLGLLLILSGSIEKNFGFLIPQLLKCPSGSMIDGVMNVKLIGALSQYQCE